MNIEIIYKFNPTDISHQNLVWIETELLIQIFVGPLTRNPRELCGAYNNLCKVKILLV